MSEQHPYRATIPPVPDGTHRPLWSVMIPTYNCAKYLRETLATVLAQDPRPEVMQIEVIDDHSTCDDPAAVVEELGRGRVGFYQQPENVGYIRNFETCLQRSRGKLIHLLHGDDCVRDGFYHKMQRAFDEQPEIGAAFCRHIYMDEHSHWQKISVLEQSVSGVLSNWLERIATRRHIETPSIVVRRDVYERLGGFDRRLPYLEDWEMWVRIAAHYPVWYEVEPLAAYRQNRLGSLTKLSVQTGENIRDVRRATEICQSYLPNSIASKLSNKARENWALYALDSIAPQLIGERDIAAAIAQIREALKCSYSFRVIRSMVRLFTWAGARWLWGRVHTVISFCRNPSSIIEFYIRPLILRNSIKHISGLKEINYAMNELIVLCVVRNGELYIKSFIEHYFSLGVKHIVFLDNGSTDDTIAIARNYENVTILQTRCPYQKYETLMKRYLVKRFSKNKWNLFSDIDELFDYPFSDVISLTSLLMYLNKNYYNAVVAQMLDLFSAKSLATLKSKKDDSLKDIYIYYDISNVQKERYPYGTASNKDVCWHWGGIRKTLFNSNNYLTKAALVFVDKKINYFVNCHQVSDARIADFTCALLHYPFLSSFYEKVVDAVKTNRYAMSASHEYEMYWERLKQDPDLNIKQETACHLENLNCLVEKDFLVVSKDYMQWVKTHCKNKSE